MTPHALPFPAPAAAAAAAAAAGGAAAEMRLEATPALLTTLCEERQMRQREIRQACAGRKSNIITFPMAAAAAAAASVNNATASASAGVGVGAEERAAHTLCRLLASVFVVPLCDWKSQSPGESVDCGGMAAISWLMLADAVHALTPTHPPTRSRSQHRAWQ
ncbi:hypothetical protein IE81DRAFT_40999 [Ceraceosorus guamensis]|uniref:Uncharacterized protein n=1 Tax=Ceraceosorus guamensis TaxID=1522189 RepID=A0A316VPP2_9BASI|nr:hypothetical protein IE81DRAFT_40999 [Ceraceosorus guamensis]PWN39254.1 hypothetical protein IE81DRAFT_40999 [Ceraceosorus guamensis]